MSSLKSLCFCYSIGFTKPSIIYLNQSVVVNEPNKLKERCEAKGFPVPKITWLQNGKQMPLCVNDGSNNCIGQNYQVTELSSDENAFSESALRIVRTMYPRDQGNYTCLASNSEGTARRTMDVFVHSKYMSNARFRVLIVYDMVHIKPRPNDCNMTSQHIATLLDVTRCVLVATML